MEKVYIVYEETPSRYSNTKGFTVSLHIDISDVETQFKCKGAGVALYEAVTNLKGWKELVYQEKDRYDDDDDEDFVDVDLSEYENFPDLESDTYFVCDVCSLVVDESQKK